MSAENPPGLDGLIDLTERLTRMIGDQTRAFDRHRPQDAGAKMPELSKLANMYRAASMGIRAQPALADHGIQATIRAAARSANLATMDLPSGAVHDAGEISRLAPMGMIFVPSHAGISHAPQEFTAPGDVANGVEVLYRTILLLDKTLGAK